MRPTPRACSALLCLSLGAAACDVKVGEKGMSVGVASETASDDWARSYMLPHDGRLEVATFGGAVEVSGSDGPQTEVRIERRATAMTKDAAQQALAMTSIREESTPDHVTIELRSSAGSMRRSPVNVHTFVRVPRGLATTLRAQNGTIRLENVDAVITAAATNGAITGRGISGGLSASVINGRLSIDLSSLSRDVQLTAMNGGIGLGLPLEIKADVDASALNGGVTIDPQLKLVTGTPDGADRGPAGGFFSNRVAGRLNGGGPKITAQVTNGGLRIGLPGQPFERRLER